MVERETLITYKRSNFQTFFFIRFVLSVGVATPTTELQIVDVRQFSRATVLITLCLCGGIIGCVECQCESPEIYSRG
jgi:hypothetical protein